ncbi:helix-turn-helix domain-containing protein [Streptomyces sp. H10-C2]|uniref:ArsR/SmtB family transcription factor n=1 Tax=unclassified Streptomyces TaxID=2593676 RepID=UPI0024B93490|nr:MULTISPECIES: helix-turn-helix domain-containing protein [unclassified Streptomyces]MDJ0341217.1 helix-turn-helix domain-containing protein [Streptomyces sp. PH10-H1]MDJ0369430.1 helix-turn-helix domain-containing protein [Streptomyces sp. H10-C2]
MSMPSPHIPTTLAALAALLADETRATVCLALLDRRAWTAGELARHCAVAPSTISEHLTRLVEGGLLVQERQGRHRYVRLADPDTARMIEDLAAHASPRKAPGTGTGTGTRTGVGAGVGAGPGAGGLRAHSAEKAMARGRTCYDHLAGRLGVSITDAMTERGMLRQDAGFAVTEAGLAWLTGLGADLAGSGGPASSRRPLARPCLDWTERRPHLAGTAGAELCRLVLDRGWATRIGTGRAVRVTPLGLDELHRTLGIEPERLEAA